MELLKWSLQSEGSTYSLFRELGEFTLLGPTVLKPTVWEATVWEVGKLTIWGSRSGRLQSGRLHSNHQIWIFGRTHVVWEASIWEATLQPPDLYLLEHSTDWEPTVWDATVWKATLQPPDLDLLILSSVLSTS